jgi:DNA invertase Pin-like site-specific DNA recombinase
MSKPVRCAIYTRKSSEDGLDQDFNTLQAQREACAAFITSQKSEGWRALPGHYDDGGISGGTLERPALSRLMADIVDGQVDLVVVYKVDRLTRSLADFAKLVERFDATNTSFVSVTQQFNTATSMGRLTLNVLLSFAQFEREVTAERIRDKIAASKQKGLWMGGLPPLGYDAKGRSLIVNPPEADTVRAVFRLYLELGCVRRVQEATNRLGLVSKRRVFANGRICGGVPLTRGRIYHLLANPIYVGEIRHKQKCYPGQHDAIIDRETFEAVRLKLSNQAQQRAHRAGAAETSPLAGKFTDETGDRLTPSHTARRGKRHRYYVSHRLIVESGTPDLTGWRLPGPALEEAVAQVITNQLKAPRNLIQRTALSTLARLGPAVSALTAKLNGPERAPTLRRIVQSGCITPERLSIQLDHVEVATSLGLEPADIRTTALSIEGAFILRRRGVEAKLVLEDHSACIDPILLKTLAQGWLWFQEIKDGTSMQAIARRHRLSQRRVAQLVDLAFLAPDIVQAIVEGRQPPTLTAEGLIRSPHHLLWDQQRAAVSRI